MKKAKEELRKRLRDAEVVHTPADELIEALVKTAKEETKPTEETKKDNWY